MTIKRKLVLGATTTFCALALTVPMTFAACPINSDCGCNKTSQGIVTPNNATCSKCKQNPCTCQKKGFFNCSVHPPVPLLFPEAIPVSPCIAAVPYSGILWIQRLFHPFGLVCSICRLLNPVFS